MANPTTNFGWQMPTSTDLVTDLPADFEVFGQAVDTSLMDLKGGTTGQVLTKASNTDMDFTWAADASGIPATIFDAKGDLIAASAADTAARLAVGTNGQVLSADSTAATGLAWISISSGGMTSIATGSMSGSATIRIQSIPSTYKFLRLYIVNHKATNTNLSLRFRLNNDSTANRYASGGELGQNISETFRYDSVYCTTDLSNTASDGMAVFEIYNYTNSTTWKMFNAMAIGNNKTTSTSIQLGNVIGAYNQTGAITEVDIYSDQGNWTTGTYTLYGVN